MSRFPVRGTGSSWFLSLAITLLLPTALASTARASQETAPASHWWLVRSVEEPVRSMLVRHFDVRGSFGDLTLVVGDGATARRLRSLDLDPEPLAGPSGDEWLFVVAGAVDDATRALPGARVLYQDAERFVLALPDRPESAPGLSQVRVRPGLLHGGVSVVPRRRQRPPSWQPTGGAPATWFSPPPYDARVQTWVDQVSKANLQADVTTLSTQYVTRRSDTQEGVQASAWLKGRFDALGLSTSLHDFDGNADNVVADLPGTLEPQKVVIVGAHYDSIVYSGSVAPGADDNASGCAALLEIARILTAANPPLRYTLRFVCFASEEFGLVGSDAYSAMLVANGVDVIAMLNTDMNAYLDPGDVHDLDMVTNDTTSWLNDLLMQISNQYVPALPTRKGSLGGGTSDHRSFFYDGYPAAFYFEDTGSYSPHIHTANDTVGTSANDFDLAQDIVKAVLAGAAVLAEPLDLSITHTPLTDTEDQWSTQVVTATVTSRIGSTPLGMDVWYHTGGAETQVPMAATGQPDEWIAELPPQPAGVTLEYRLEAWDDQGNQEFLPADGSSLPVVFGRQDTFFLEDFENGNGGFTHTGTQDDWQRGAPAGKSTDPSAAWSGSAVFGTDLGAGGWNGEYPPNAASRLVSPPIDASGQSGVHLRYARWLGVEDASFDKARIRVEDTVVWQNQVGLGTQHHVDTQWVLHDLDVSALADGNAAVDVAFTLNSDAGLEFGGWNVDDVELYTLGPGTRPALFADTGFVSLTGGKAVTLDLDLGASHAGQRYLFLAGISGTVPGLDVGTVHVDLNWDGLTSLLLGMSGGIQGFRGTLDQGGRAVAILPAVPGLDPALAGTVLSLVAITLGPTDAASNPVGLLFIQ